MTVTYQWGIRRVDRRPTFTDPATNLVYQDVLTGLHWTCTATDGVNTVSSYGSVPIVWDRSVEPFTLFANLTRAQVAGWAQTNLNSSDLTVARIRAGLAGQLAAMAAPQIVPADTPAWN